MLRSLRICEIKTASYQSLLPGCIIHNLVDASPCNGHKGGRCSYAQQINPLLYFTFATAFKETDEQKVQRANYRCLTEAGAVWWEGKLS